MQSKSYLSHIPRDLNNVQVTDRRDIREYCITLAVPNLTSRS